MRRARSSNLGAKGAAAEPRPNLSSRAEEITNVTPIGKEIPARSLDGGADARTPAESAVTPDDFASGLQKSIDDLQTRLSSLTNPITNFAIKEFRIEAPVVVSVSKLGTLLYRFLGPSENVEPSAVTRISLTIVPIEKQSSVGSLPSSLFRSDARVEDLAGIDPATVDTLRQHKIYTVSDLWQIGSRASARVELEALLKVDRARLSGLLSEAGLLLVKGIGTTEAQILFKLGIKSLADLSKLQPQALAQRFNQTAEKKDSQLDLAVAETWIKAARSYTGLTSNVIATASSSSVND